MSNEDELKIRLEVATRLNNAMAARGVGAKDIAKKTGFSHQLVNSYRRGDTALDVPRLFTIAKAVGCPVDELLPLRTAKTTGLNPEDYRRLKNLAKLPIPILRQLDKIAQEILEIQNERS